jgi:phospholipid/cholesterol/gamma-HCH transport system substrate-binding protein
MNLSKAQKIRLGTFVAVGSTLLFGGIISLAGVKVLERRDTYTVKFKDSVSGLEKSSQVRYQGLRVGRVESMRVSPEDPSSIEVSFSLNPGTVLHEGTTAVLDASGITGLKTINLTAGDARKKVIEPGSELPSGVSFVDRITGEAEQIGIKVEMVANQIAKWSSDENRLRFEELLSSSAKLATEMERFTSEVRQPAVGAMEEFQRSGAAFRVAATEGTQLMKDTRETVLAAKAALQEADRILKTVDSKSLSGTVHAAEAAMTSLDRRLSAAEFGATIKNLQSTLANLTTLLGEVDLTVRASRDDFVSSLEHVRQATEDLREFSRIIAQDPSAILRGKEVSE